ncbi:ATP-binding protein [Chloroflexota bacterium]
MGIYAEYLNQFQEQYPKVAVALVRACADGNLDDLNNLLNKVCRNPSVPIEMAAALAYDAATTSLNPELQQKAIQAYLVMKCIDAMGLDRKTTVEFDDILTTFINCKVPAQCRDISIVMARILLVDDSWYLKFNATDVMREWLQKEWPKILPTRLRPRKKQTIGKIIDILKGQVGDAQHQCEDIASEAITCLKENRFRQLDGLLVQAGRLLSGYLWLLTRQEQIIARDSLALWAELRVRIRASNETMIVSTPDDAGQLLRDLQGGLYGLLRRGEFALLSMCIPLQIGLMTHVREEMQRWGVEPTAVEIVAERPAYTFEDNKSTIILEIRNKGTVGITHASILVKAESDIDLLPSSFDLRDILSGDIVKQEVQANITSGCRRLDIFWRADIEDEFGVKRQSKDKIAIEVNRDVPWEEIELRPNPYPTDPVETADRLYGREDKMRELARVVISSESRYLTGQRRVGKTSVARVLLDTLDKQKYITAYAPWGEIGAGAFSTVCQQLCNILSEEAVLIQPSLSKIKVPPLTIFESGFNQATISFIRQIRNASQLSIVIILDDFDDVPRWVFTGETGELFFAMLKTLTGSKGISLIFVGGQRLRTIMRSTVAGKLNQVTAIDVGYLPQGAMQELLAGPTREVLHFNDSAIDRLTYWTSCNPFYVNHICNKLWNFLIGNKWTTVVADDIERIVHQTVTQDDSSIFSHFWQDGIWGDGDIQEAAISSNITVLYTLGQIASSNPSAHWFRFDEIKQACPYLNGEDLRRWLADLAGREVIEVHEESSDQYRIRVPYFQLWLSKRGKSELYMSLDPSIVLRAQKPEEEVVSDEELESLVGTGIAYRSGPIGVYEIRKFLRQFGSRENQCLIYKLIERFFRDGSFSQSDVQDAALEAMKALYEAARSMQPEYVKVLNKSGVWTNVFLVILNNTQVTSFQALADIIRQEDNLPKSQTGKVEQLVDFVRKQKAPVSVILFDDVIGTGETASEAIQEVLDAITREGIEQRVACILFYAVVGFRDVIDQLNQSMGEKVVVQVRRKLAEADQAFSPEAGIFDNEKEREQAHKLVHSIGEKLESKSPLGYGNRQALISFYRNTPNITLPIFYKRAKRKDFIWEPLTRRM